MEPSLSAWAGLLGASPSAWAGAFALLKTVFCILYHITSIHPSPDHLHTFVVLIAESFLPSHSLGILQGEGVGQQFQEVARSTLAHSLLTPVRLVDVLTKEFHLAPEVVVQAPTDEVLDSLLPLLAVGHVEHTGFQPSNHTGTV